jgi:hypothetical protein
VLVPSQNPDGEQLVVDWYKKYLGTPYEGTQPVVIWHHYTGHDDNRDWATFTQVETRPTTEKVLNRWHPEILYDMHHHLSHWSKWWPETGSNRRLEGPFHGRGRATELRSKSAA